MKDKLLLFCLIASGLFIQCNSRNSINQNLQREWMMVEMDGYTKQDLINQKAKMSVTFNPQSHQFLMSSSLGCNFLTGSLRSLSYNQFIINPLTSTDRNCDDMKLENDFKKLFVGKWNYNIEGHFLILKNKEGKVLKWIAADWD